LCLLLSIVVVNGFVSQHLDVKPAFLYGELTRESTYAALRAIRISITLHT
jgi:hypothetical protein